MSMKHLVRKKSHVSSPGKRAAAAYHNALLLATLLKVYAEEGLVAEVRVGARWAGRIL
jgi:hypothetical protein